MARTRLNFRKTSYGFSLIELSVVLVIIALMAGAVIGGTSLLHIAKLRTMITQYNEFRTAFNTFEHAYNALPGDINNAYDYWPNVGGCTSAFACNGNGNGNFDASSSDGYRAWMHLALAKMIPGSYDGNFPGSAAEEASGKHCPLVRYDRRFCWLGVDETGSLGKIYFTAGYVIGLVPIGGFLGPRDMAELDKKMDDGMPRTGKMQVYTPTSSTGTYSCLTGPGLNGYGTLYHVSVTTGGVLYTATGSVCGLMMYYRD